MTDLYEVFNEINQRGLNIDKAEVARLHHELKSMKNRSVYILFDKGYVSKIGEINVSELILALIQEFGDDKLENLFSASSGEWYISPETTFLTMKRTDDEELKTVMKVLHDYCYADELLQELLELLGSVTKDGLLRPKLSISSNYMRAKVSNFINRKEFMRIMVKEKPIYFINTKALMYFEFLASLGIPESTVADYKQRNEGMLVRELSFDEEIEIAGYIADFNLMANTEFANLYDEQRTRNYNPKVKKYEKDAYFKNLADDIVTIMDSVQGNELIPRLITKHQMIVELKNETISKQLFDVIGSPFSVRSTKSRIWEKGGLYTLEWYEGTELSKCNALRGYTGEFIKEENLKNLGLSKGEYPLELVLVSREGDDISIKKEIVYRVDDLGLEQRVGSDIVFEYTPVNSVCEKLGISSLEEGYKKVLETLDDTKMIKQESKITQYYKMVVADLIMTLIALDCGVEYCSRIPLDDRLDILYDNDDYIFYCACLDAEDYIKSNKLFE